MIAPINTLPDSSRIWIYAADRQLSSAETQDLSSTLNTYLAGWKAHGAPVQAALETRHNQFLIIAADPEVASPGGCSIDDMTRTVKTLGAQFHVDFFVAMRVYYRASDGTIRTTDRAGFKALAIAGDITPETVVFDNALTSLADLRAGKWELPAVESWHARYFETVMA